MASGKLPDLTGIQKAVLIHIPHIRAAVENGRRRHRVAQHLHATEGQVAQVAHQIARHNRLATGNKRAALLIKTIPCTQCFQRHIRSDSEVGTHCRIANRQAEARICGRDARGTRIRAGGCYVASGKLPDLTGVQKAVLIHIAHIGAAV